MAVEALEQVSPLFSSLFDGVELAFELRGVASLKDVGEIFHQQRGDHGSHLRGHELLRDLLDVVALLDRINDGGVGGRTADSLLFQRLHQ